MHLLLLTAITNQTATNIASQDIDTTPIAVKCTVLIIALIVCSVSVWVFRGVREAARDGKRLADLKAAQLATTDSHSPENQEHPQQTLP